MRRGLTCLALGRQAKKLRAGGRLSACQKSETQPRNTSTKQRASAHQAYCMAAKHCRHASCRLTWQPCGEAAITITALDWDVPEELNLLPADLSSAGSAKMSGCGGGENRSPWWSSQSCPSVVCWACWRNMLVRCTSTGGLLPCKRQAFRFRACCAWLCCPRILLPS